MAGGRGGRAPAVGHALVGNPLEPVDGATCPGCGSKWTVLSWGSPPRGPKEEVVTCRTPPASRVQGFTCPFLSTEQVPLRGYVSFNSSDEQPLEGGSLCYRDVTSPINERDVESSSSSSRGALPQQARLGLGRGWGLLRRVRRGARVSEPVRGSVQTDRSRPWSGESLGASVCSFTACPAQCLGLPENRADEPCCVRRVRGPSSQHGAEATRWQAGRELGWAARCHGQACGQAPLSPFRQKSRPSLLTLGSRGAAAARAWPGPRASAARPPWRATR